MQFEIDDDRWIGIEAASSICRHVLGIEVSVARMSKRVDIRTDRYKGRPRYMVKLGDFIKAARAAEAERKSQSPPSRRNEVVNALAEIMERLKRLEAK